MRAITRRAALGGIAAISATGAAGAASAAGPDTMTPEEVDRRIGELASEIAELLPHHPVQGLGKRGWYVGVSEYGYWYAARPAPKAPEPDDPLLDAIAAYEDGMRAYERDPIGRTLGWTEEEMDAVVEATYGPPLEVLEAWDRPAVSREGAIAALRFMQQEARDFSRPGCMEAMLSAALGYLERGGRP